MLKDVKTKSYEVAGKTERKAGRFIGFIWNFLLDLLWLIVIIVIVSLFIWALVKGGIVTDQPILQTIAGWVDAALASIQKLLNN